MSKKKTTRIYIGDTNVRFIFERSGLSSENQDSVRATSLAEIIGEKSYDFVSPTKRKVKWITNMRDSATNKDLWELATFSSDGTRCWWCTYDYSTQTLGCPVEYDEMFDCYTTVGRFCGWRCVIAFAKTKNTDARFVNSIPLINQMFYSVHDKQDKFPLPAPDKTFLKCYGGFMTIEQFRNECETMEFADTRNIVSFPSPEGDVNSNRKDHRTVEASNVFEIVKRF